MVVSAFLRAIVVGVVVMVPFSLVSMESKQVIKHEIKVYRSPGFRRETITTDWLKDINTSEDEKFTYIRGFLKEGDKVQLCNIYSIDPNQPPKQCFFKKDVLKNNEDVLIGTQIVKVTMLDAKEVENIKNLSLFTSTTGSVNNNSVSSQVNNSEEVDRLFVEIFGVSSDERDIDTESRVELKNDKDEDSVDGSGGDIIKHNLTRKFSDENEKGQIEQKKNQDQTDSSKEPKLESHTSWTRFFTMRRIFGFGVFGVATIFVILKWDYLRNSFFRS